MFEYFGYDQIFSLSNRAILSLVFLELKNGKKIIEFNLKWHLNKV